MHEQLTRAGWWHTAFGAVILGPQSLYGLDADDLVCGMDLTRPASPNPEVLRVICPGDSMLEWLKACAEHGSCLCPKHIEEKIEVGLVRYVATAIITRMDNPLGYSGRWRYRFFRGALPPVGPTFGVCEIDVERAEVFGISDATAPEGTPPVG